MPDANDAGADRRAGASDATRAANVAMAAELDFSDRRDFDEAARGLIAPLPDGGKVVGADGEPVWDLSRFGFIAEGADAPETVNPSLWRQMQLVVQGGLYEVVPGLYQVRTLDLSNITIAEGDDGIVVFDPLISTETARAALDLYYAHRPRKPVLAVVHSHSHVDHYGGVRGIVEEADVRAGKVKIIAPEGFLEAALAENVLAGTVMSRRSSYMYGNLLPADPKGQVGAGLGVSTSSGTVTVLPPTDHVTETGQTDDDRRARLRVHARARQRGAGGDALVHRAVQGGHRGRELLPHAAQHLLHPRHEDPRSAGMVEVP